MLLHFIVEHQQTIHLKCYGLAPGVAVGHWSGLEFFNTTTALSINDAVIINEASSQLEYVDLEYAGVTQFGDPTPAIRADPYAPSLKHVTIRYSALDGTNFTNVRTSTIVEDSHIHNNRGNSNCSFSSYESGIIIK